MCIRSNVRRLTCKCFVTCLVGHFGTTGNTLRLHQISRRHPSLQWVSKI